MYLEYPRKGQFYVYRKYHQFDNGFNNSCEKNHLFHCCTIVEKNGKKFYIRNFSINFCIFPVDKIYKDNRSNKLHPNLSKIDEEEFDIQRLEKRLPSI